MIEFLLSQLIALTAGVLLMAALGAWRMPLGLFVPTAWLGGTGALAAERLLLSQIGVHWDPLSLLLPWLAVAGLAAWRVRVENKGQWVNRLRDVRQSLPGLQSLTRPAFLVEVLAGVIIIMWTAKMLMVATTTPQLGWDAMVDWLFKGKAMYLAGGLPLDFYANPQYGGQLAVFAHLDYPPFVPLTVAHIYAWTGDNDMLVKGWWALLAGAMVAGVYFGLNGLVGIRARLGGLVLLLAMPAIAEYATGYFAGYAELPMAVTFVYGALFLYRWLKQPTSAEFALSALFFSITGFTKNEGLVMAGVGLVLLFGLGLARKRLTWEGALVAGAMASLIIAPWQIEKRTLNLTSDLHPNLASMLSNWNERFDLIAQSLAHNASDVNRLNLTWVLLPLLALSALAFAPRRWLATLPVLALILAHLAASVAAYLTTPYDIHWHLGTSVDRVVFQSTLVAALLSIIYLGLIFDKQDPVTQTSD